jgi:hypothetical protein
VRYSGSDQLSVKFDSCVKLQGMFAQIYGRVSFIHVSTTQNEKNLLWSFWFCFAHCLLALADEVERCQACLSLTNHIFINADTPFFLTKKSSVVQWLRFLPVS